MKNPFAFVATLIAMAASSFVVDAIVAEQTEGTLPPEAPAAMGSSLGCPRVWRPLRLPVASRPLLRTPLWK